MTHFDLSPLAGAAEGERLRLYIRTFPAGPGPFLPLRRPRAPGALSLRRCGPPVTADAMGFGDLRTAAGLQVLNDYLADKSYIEG